MELAIGDTIEKMADSLAALSEIPHPPAPQNEPMQIEIEPQPYAIERRQELLADPELARLPFKIETDRFGRVLLFRSKGAWEIPSCLAHL